MQTTAYPVLPRPMWIVCAMCRILCQASQRRGRGADGEILVAA